MLRGSPTSTTTGSSSSAPGCSVAPGGRFPRALVDARAPLGGARALRRRPLLDRVRAATDVPLLLFKGPEVAARYPDPALRMFRDVDLIARTPGRRSERFSLAAASRRSAIPSSVPGHSPSAAPEVARAAAGRRASLAPEVGRAPRRPRRRVVVRGRAARQLTGADGCWRPSPARHAVLLAVHSWAHEPLRILRDMVDVAALAAEASREEVAEVAREWGVERLWATTVGRARLHLLGRPSGRSPFGSGRRTSSLSASERCSRSTPRALAVRFLGAAVRRRAAPARARRLCGELTPDRGEGWRRKLSRSCARSSERGTSPLRPRARSRDQLGRDGLIGRVARPSRANAAIAPSMRAARRSAPRGTDGRARPGRPRRL